MIEDEWGAEVYHTGSTSLDDEHIMLAQVCWMLVKANESNIVTIDGVAFDVRWK